MNKFVKISLIIIALIILVFGGIYVKKFIIGSKDYKDIVIEKVTTSSNEIIIKGNITASGKAYKSYKYTQVGDELYVTITSVSVSNKYKEGNFEIKIPIQNTKVKYIHLSDDKTTKVIYNNDN